MLLVLIFCCMGKYVYINIICYLYIHTQYTLGYRAKCHAPIFHPKSTRSTPSHTH